MIKVDLITGFLGAGKTTFLLKYARHLMNKGLRIGILEYDYGAINVDMVLLNKLRGDKCELEMLAAACDEDCLTRRFNTKLIAMAMSGYDRVIIEPSGVFDMDRFFDALRDEPLETWYEIGNVITVVNGKLNEELSEREQFLLASQAACAGTILFSRVKQATSEELELSKEKVLNAQKAIKCSHVNNNFFCKDWNALTKEDMDSLENSGYVLNDYVKVTAGMNLPYSSVSFLEIKETYDSLLEKISILFNNGEYGNVIRVKGFVGKDGMSCQINATRYELFTEPVAIGQHVLIVIGTNLNEEKIRELINV